MKKVLYSLIIGATALCIASCGNDNKTSDTTPANTAPDLNSTVKDAPTSAPMVKEIVKGDNGKPITIETVRGKMHGQIEFPGAITLTNPEEAKNVLHKLTPAQGKNTYNCAVLFTGTPKKGKIWNFTHNPITVDVEWKYEDGSTSTDQVVVESQKFGFTHADDSKGKTKTITYNVIEQQ